MPVKVFKSDRLESPLDDSRASSAKTVYDDFSSVSTFGKGAKSPFSLVLSSRSPFTKTSFQRPESVSSRLSSVSLLSDTSRSGSGMRIAAVRMVTPYSSAAVSEETHFTPLECLKELEDALNEIPQDSAEMTVDDDLKEREDALNEIPQDSAEMAFDEY